MSLKILHESPKSTLDIVALHGLGGDHLQTWTHPDTKKLWLKDLLPSKVPNARIMTFSYKANVAFGKSVATVRDHGITLVDALIDKRSGRTRDRPIIFIAHSLGGIIVKAGILQAHLDPRHKSIARSTTGIMFFGTPHRGSPHASLGVVLKILARVVLGSSAPLMRALEENSQELFELMEQVKYQLNRYTIVSFVEKLPLGPLRHPIVMGHSATLSLPNEDVVPLDEDHISMVKFADEESVAFERTWNRIQRIRAGLRPSQDRGSSAARERQEHALSRTSITEEEIRTVGLKLLLEQRQQRQQQQSGMNDPQIMEIMAAVSQGSSQYDIVFERLIVRAKGQAKRIRRPVNGSDEDEEDEEEEDEEEEDEAEID